MKYFLIFLSILSVEAFASMDSWCQLKLSNNICANIHFKAPVSRKKDATFEIYFTQTLEKSNKVIVLDEKPSIKLWMIMKGGHGHGSDKVKISEINKTDKKYQVSNVWFLMLGEWEIKINGKYKGKEFSGSPYICIRKDSKKTSFGKCK